LKAQGTARPSFISQLLDDNKDGAEGEDIIQWLGATSYSGGAHTTIGVLTNFLLAMVLYPEVMKRAREEIDGKVGTGRLPGMEDRAELVYVECVILEVLRWRNVLPLSELVARRLLKQIDALTVPSWYLQVYPTEPWQKTNIRAIEFPRGVL
jgi:cytochrome P450